MVTSETNIDTPAVPSPSTSPGADSAFRGDMTIINPAAMDDGSLTVVSEDDAKSSRSNPDYIREWKAKLKAGLANQRASVFAIADLLVEADSRLHESDFKAAWKEAGFGSLTNVKNYIRVAAARHLRKPEYQPYMPVSVGQLIDLVKWTEDELKASINAKVMTPTVSREKLKKWLQDSRPKSSANDEQAQNDNDQSPIVYEAAFVVYVEKTSKPKQRKRIIQKMLESLSDAQNDRVVVRKVTDTDVQGVVDKLVNQDAEPLRTASGGLEPRRPTTIRREEDVVEMEPWDEAAHGKQPGALV